MKPRRLTFRDRVLKAPNLAGDALHDILEEEEKDAWDAAGCPGTLAEWLGMTLEEWADYVRPRCTSDPDALEELVATWRASPR